MFFKRKNINPDFERKATSVEEEEREAPKAVESAPQTPPTKPTQVNLDKVPELDKAQKQEQDVKHYFHKKLLETLDLGVLSNLEEGRAKKELQEAVSQLMNDDKTHPSAWRVESVLSNKLKTKYLVLALLSPC